jgi:hypothetical protein
VITWLHAPTKWYEHRKKVTLITEIENAKKKNGVRSEYGLVNFTIQTIWKNRTKIISAFEQNGSIIQRFRKPERRDADEVLLQRFKQQRCASVPANCPL